MRSWKQSGQLALTILRRKGKLSNKWQSSLAPLKWPHFALEKGLHHQMWLFSFKRSSLLQCLNFWSQIANQMSMPKGHTLGLANLQKCKGKQSWHQTWQQHTGSKQSLGKVWVVAWWNLRNDKGIFWCLEDRKLWELFFFLKMFWHFNALRAVFLVCFLKSFV